MSDKPSDWKRIQIILNADGLGDDADVYCSPSDALERSAAEFSRPHRERIADLEAQLRSALNFANKRSAELESKVVRLKAEYARLRDAVADVSKAVNAHDAAQKAFESAFYTRNVPPSKHHEMPEYANLLDEQNRLNDAASRLAYSIAEKQDERSKSDHVHELGSCSHCDRPKACPGCGAVEPAYYQIGCRITQPCTCPATSELDPPCPRHGVLGIGVTGRD